MKRALIVVALLLVGQASAEERFHCNLHALTKAERLRDRELAQQLHAVLLEHKELPEGYALRFTGAELPRVAEWLAIISKCCQPIDYQLQLGPQPGGPLWLRISGGEGAKEFLKGEFETLLN
ncbi:MAG TPA: hypothetical protein VH083_00980 [Myxococcales bacterium]|jgi:hypothetical protein|nr:hypothetical protein [Myxococcales bacterium]